MPDAKTPFHAIAPAVSAPNVTRDPELHAKAASHPAPVSMAELRAQVDLLLRITARQEGRCGARTRKGEPCQAKGRLHGKRCRMHGGCSTGPRTEPGRARIAEAQRNRWAQWRAANRPGAAPQPPSETTAR